jgi:glycosyltransferase involved in cell wall biosynthesis
MPIYIRKSKDVDVMFLAEGTYPYIRGGVSSWIAQILRGMPDIRFGICFIGSRSSDYSGIKYELPDNLVHLEVHYMFEDSSMPPVKKREGSKEAFKAIEALYKGFKEKKDDIPKVLQNMDFYKKQVSFEDFLYSKEAWKFINKIYLQNAPDVPFIDYFWTLRNIHKPVWLLADIVRSLPKTKLFHSPSTGYAGFLGALASYDTKRPLLLTEHGIYTRERKIDMLSADWIEYKKPVLLQQPEEFNYVKKMWVEFFKHIGKFSYNRAELILSLFSSAREIEISLGAPREKTRVIPNGVDVDRLKEAFLQREDNSSKKVITLIGRVVSIKDIKTFIRAMRICVGEISNLEGWIVGPTDEDEEYYLECKEMVESFGLEKNILFLGFQNIMDILPKTTLLTLTSISEGMPLVILEGFAAGVPCVATDVGSCRDLISGGLGEEDRALGDAGAITGIANPADLAEKYLYYLKNEEAWRKAQKCALLRVEKYYREDDFLEKYYNLYQEYMQKEAK